MDLPASLPLWMDSTSGHFLEGSSSANKGSSLPRTLSKNAEVIAVWICHIRELLIPDVREVKMVGAADPQLLPPRGLVSFEPLPAETVDNVIVAVLAVAEHQKGLRDIDGAAEESVNEGTVIVDLGDHSVVARHHGGANATFCGESEVHLGGCIEGSAGLFDKRRGDLQQGVEVGFVVSVDFVKKSVLGLVVLNREPVHAATSVWSLQEW
ncbi:hypothetical protein BU16DRAFT_564308 [Lophium mytilinum]|uniref:Uncharacterized protein n=1 Tax=Lophium mytilinum TaxID=390894 RepID=A0A6A6QL05_9PEZI|nr:hypothetical protein BU16DRAFT_564308 [Lophium mytilinum]